MYNSVGTFCFVCCVFRNGVCASLRLGTYVWNIFVKEYHCFISFIQVFLNRRAAARYLALASIIPGRERPEETIICFKISLIQ